MRKEIIFFIGVIVIFGSFFGAQLSIAIDVLGFLSIFSGVMVPSLMVSLSAVLSIVIFSLLFALEMQQLFSLLSKNNHNQTQEGGGVTRFLANHPVFACIFKLFLYSNVVALSVATVTGLNVAAVYSGMIYPMLMLIVTGTFLCEKLYYAKGEMVEKMHHLNKTAAVFFALFVAVAIVGVVFAYSGLVFLPVSVVVFFVAVCYTFFNAYSRVSGMCKKIQSVFSNEAGSALSVFEVAPAVSVSKTDLATPDSEADLAVSVSKTDLASTVSGSSMVS